MHLLITILIPLTELWFLGVLTLSLHRLSQRYGHVLMMVFLGMLTAVLQLNLLGTIHFTSAQNSIDVTQGSFLILPILLLGLLIIYISDGTTLARLTMTGIILVTLAIILLQTLMGLQSNADRTTFTGQPDHLLSNWALFASALTLVIDFLLMIVVYQLISNARTRCPSRLAGCVAILVAANADALIYPILSSPSNPGAAGVLIFHLAGKSLAAISLWPFIALHISRWRKEFPASAAAAPRPALDILSRIKDLEEHSRHQESLLRTLSQINQLILRIDDPNTLLDEACKQLIHHRNYLLVWIGLHEENQQQIVPNAWAGKNAGYLENLQISLDPESPFSKGPTGMAISTGKASTVRDIARHRTYTPWRASALERGYASSASFPMRYNQRVLGALNIYARQVNAFLPDEMDLMQELADDLAYALISMQARKQHSILHAAAETMQDGMAILDNQGIITYVNHAMAELFNASPDSIYGKPIQELLPNLDRGERFTRSLAILKEQGRINFDYEMHRNNQDARVFSISASLFQSIKTQPEFIVISLRDTTQRKQNETRLVALNRLVTDLVQSHQINELTDQLFRAAEALLQADSGAIYILSPDHRVSEIYRHNLSDEYLNFISNHYRELPPRASIQSMRPITVEDTLKVDGYGDQLHSLANYGIRALMSLPLIFQDSPLGALVLHYQQPHIFVDDELQLGQTLARTLAIVMQNVHLFQAEHSQRQFSEALAEAAAALNSSLVLEEVLDIILEQTLRVVQCRAVNLMLIDQNKARVVRAMNRSSPDIIRRTGNVEVSLELPTLQQMMNSGQPLIIPNTTIDELWRNLEYTSWILSYAGTPLQIQDKIIGFLSMNSDQVNFFSAEIRPRLQAFAATAATAIQNARLYEELRQHTQELELRVQERTAELSNAKERIERILVSVPDAVFVLDHENNLLQSNPAGEALLAASAINQQDLFAPEMLEKLKIGQITYDQAILDVQGRAYQALASSLPFQGGNIGMVIVLRDVTRFRELDQMKTRFVSDVSHELRTPLTNLSIYLDLLTTVDQPDKRARYLGTLRRETERLTHLIEDLLTISRLEAGRLEFKLEPIDISPLISNLAEDRTPMAAQVGLTITHKCQPEIPRAWADPRLLVRVLSNLLTNAMNYTPPPGNISICASLESKDEVEWVAIEIKDTGVGIEPADRENLFKRFYRGAASEITGAPGTGLGLAISKEIIDRMNGHIALESEPGKGSTFTVWLRAVL